MSLFKVRSADFTNNIVIGSYEVNRKDVYEEYKDGAGTNHRVIEAKKISGSFDIFFKNMSDYNNFIFEIKSALNMQNRVPITVKPNNTNVETAIEAYVDFSPKRTVDGRFNDRMMQFKVDIEEA